jgi:chemotaxis protein MotA
MKMKNAGYLQTSARRFDSLAASLGLCGVVAALAAVTGSLSVAHLFDLSSLIFIALGTVSVVFLQYDLASIFRSVEHTLKTFVPMRIRHVRAASWRLDEVIESGGSLVDLEAADELTGQILNDVRFLFDSGLSFDEIDEVLSSAFVSEVLNQRRSSEVFQRASQVAPALGLLGTVLGLIGVLKSLGKPEEIGPAMSLALMTTAYGAALGSLIFGPLAGRLDASAEGLLHLYREILRKAHILYLRTDVDLNYVRKKTAGRKD